MTQNLELDRFIQSMESSTTQLMEAIRRRAPRVDTAPVAEQLGSYSDIQIEELFRAKVREHTQVLGSNVHGITPESLGLYPKSTMDGVLEGLLDSDSPIPLSFYGDHEYLGPAIAGEFKAPAGVGTWGHMGMFLEDNGTLVILRSGTDGESTGVYYSYLKDALTTPDLGGVVATNVRYSPGYFPEGSVAIGLLYCADEIIIGVLGDGTSLNPTGYFLSITGGTYDHRHHKGVVIPLNAIINPYSTADNPGVLYGLPLAYIDSGKVFVLTDLRTPSEFKVGCRVWSLQLQDVLDGHYQNVVREMGWTIIKGSHGEVRSDDLELTADIRNAGLITTPSSNDVWTLSNQVVADNRIVYGKDGKRLVSLGTGLRITKSDGSTNTLFTATFVFELGASKTVDIGRYYDEPLVMSYPSLTAVPGSNAWPTNNCPLTEHLGRINHISQNYHRSVIHRSHYTERNVVFVYAHATESPNVGMSLSRWIYDPALNTKSLLEGDAVRQSSIGTTPRYRYLSPVTTMITSLSNAGDNVLFGWNQRPELSRRDWVRFRHGGNMSHVHRSASGSELSGFGPTEDRSWLSSSDSNQLDMIGLVNETDVDGWKLHKARFDSLTNTSRSRPASIDQAGIGTGYVTLSQTAYTSLSAQIALRLGLLSITPAPAVLGPTLWYEVVVPQRYTDLPVFAYGFVVDQNRQLRNFVVSLELEGTRTNITSLQLIPTSMVVTGAINVGMALDCGTSADIAGGNASQICIRRSGDRYVLGISSSARPYLSVGRRSFGLLVEYGLGGWVNKGLVKGDVEHEYIGFVNYPTHGLFLTYCSEKTDSGTKVVGQLIDVDDLQNIDVYLQKILTKDPSCRVISTQVTASKWSVYAEATNAMIAGTYRELPAVTLGLNRESMANKRLHLWVTKTQSGLSYSVTEGYSTPEDVAGYLYLGYIDTDDQGVVSVDVDKTLAIGDKAISRFDRGSSIPVSEGLPSRSGNLMWR